MPSMPYTRKAGDGGACAVLIGSGDGTLARDAMGAYDRVVVIHMPGELPLDGAPKHVDQYVIRSVGDAAEVISHGFAHQSRVLDLEGTDFYSAHPSASDPAIRTAFAREFFSLLSARPFTMGDDVIDGLQGAFHIALAAHKLIGAPTPDELPRLDCPVIAVAPGPSLAKHLDTLRSLQHTCLIICADTALEGLLKAGITPHIVTPLERVPAVVDESFPAAHYPGVIFAGTPVVHQHIAEKFDRHILIPGSDVLFLWMGARVDQVFFYGQSTGVLAATLGTRLTTGPVYLVGHDLAFNGATSHWGAVHSGVQLGDTVTRSLIPGNNGGMVETQDWWKTFLGELSELAKATGRIVNVNGSTGDGALIPHALSDALPDYDHLHPLVPLPEFPPENTGRLNRFRDLLQQLPDDVRSIMLRLSSNQCTLADIDFRTLCDSDNRLMLGYILRSVIGQFGMQHRNGMDEGEIAADASDAIRNVLRQLMPTFERMASAPVCQPITAKMESMCA